MINSSKMDSSSMISSINQSSNSNKSILGSINSSINSNPRIPVRDWNYNTDSGIQTKMPSSKANSCTSRDEEMDTIFSLSQNSNMYELNTINSDTTHSLNSINKPVNQHQLNEQFVSQANSMNHPVNKSQFINQTSQQMTNFKTTSNMSYQTNQAQISQSANKSESVESSSIDYQYMANTLPDIIEILNDPDQVVAISIVEVIYSILKDEKRRKIIINSVDLVKSLIRLADDLVRSLVQTGVDQTDKLSEKLIETLRYITAIFHDFSLSRPGLQIIFQNNVLPTLYQLIDLDIEEYILNRSITTLHNLLLKQEGATSAVHRTNGVPTLVRLLSKDNVRLLAIVSDCLQLTAYRNQDVKQIILQCGGPQEFIRIMRTYDYEKLLLIITRVIKVLSVCPKNKKTIVQFSGMQALAKNLNHANLRIVLNSLWALRNLSDAAINQTHMNELLQKLVLLLNSENINVVTCAAGILANLTCNNHFNKQIVCEVNGLNILLQTLVKAGDREEILEPTLCALRHLTCRHQNAEYCQNLVRINRGLEQIIRLLHPPSKWSIVKASINLIRNLALCESNIKPLKETGVIQRLFQLLTKAQQEIKRVCAYSRDKIAAYNNIAIDADGIKMYEIIEATLGTFQILSKDQSCCEMIVSMDLISVCIDMIYYPLENVQKVAVGCLNEFANLPAGLQKIELEDHSIFQNLLSSPNELISNTASSILDRLRENINSYLFNAG